MSAKKKTSSWPLAHAATDLNPDTNLLKLLAIAFMIIDHSGKMIFHSNNMRIIGRLAFPMFAYCIAVGCVYTKSHLKYLTRLVAVGLISQPFYALALGHTFPAMYAIPFKTNPVAAALNFYVQSWGKPSIFLTLALGLLVIWSLREKQLVLTAALMVFIWLASGKIDYGWQGVALIVLFYLFINHWWLSLPIVTAFFFWWRFTRGGSYHLFGLSFEMGIFAVAALPLIYAHTHSGLKINKWVFYLFYPAHLVGLLLIEMALKTA